MKKLVMMMGLVAALSWGQLASRKTLTLEAAKKIAAAAAEEAKKNNWTVVIAIVDEGANLVYLEKIDGTQIGSIEIAQMKARTAIKMKRPSKAFEDMIAGGRTTVIKLPDVLGVEGGLPLVVDGQVLGAIGVSGVASQQDGQIAAAGVKALEGMK